MPMKSKSNLSHTLVPGLFVVLDFFPVILSGPHQAIILVERYVIGAAR